MIIFRGKLFFEVFRWQGFQNGPKKDVFQVLWKIGPCKFSGTFFPKVRLAYRPKINLIEFLRKKTVLGRLYQKSPKRGQKWFFWGVLPIIFWYFAWSCIEIKVQNWLKKLFGKNLILKFLGQKGFKIRLLEICKVSAWNPSDFLRDVMAE